MANHVENYIKVKNCNQVVIVELQRIFSVKDEIGDTGTIDLINCIYDKEWTNDDYDRTMKQKGRDMVLLIRKGSDRMRQSRKRSQNR
jgi:hypothetical protein